MRDDESRVESNHNLRSSYQMICEDHQDSLQKINQVNRSLSSKPESAGGEEVHRSLTKQSQPGLH